MNTETRLETTKFIWGSITGIMFFLFLSAGLANGLEAGHVILGVSVLIAGAISTGVIWTPSDSNANDFTHSDVQEKAKRERLDSVLRDLSDDELIALKNRLSDGSVDDEVLYERMSLSDDGELISAGGK